MHPIEEAIITNLLNGDLEAAKAMIETLSPRQKQELGAAANKLQSLGFSGL